MTSPIRYIMATIRGCHLTSITYVEDQDDDNVHLLLTQGLFDFKVNSLRFSYPHVCILSELYNAAIMYVCTALNLWTLDNYL